MDELKCPKCGENLKVTPIGNEGAYGKKCECGYIARNDLALAFDWQKKAYQFADDFEMAVHKTLELVATLSELRVRVEGIEVGEIQDVIDAERNTGINWTYNMAKSVKSFLIKTLLKGGEEMKTCNHDCGSKKSCANYRNIKCFRCKHYGGGTFWKCYFKKPKVASNEK
jgi:hypothetical protein